MKNLIKKILKEGTSSGDIINIGGIEFIMKSDNRPYSSGLFLKPNDGITMEEYNGVATILNNAGLECKPFSVSRESGVRHSGATHVWEILIEIDIKELLIIYLDIRLDAPNNMDQLRNS